MLWLPRCHESKLIEFELRIPRSGTYIMKPTASCEAAQLWVSDRYVSPRVTALTGCSAMVGCGATARRHSLLCLYWLLKWHLWENIFSSC